MADVKDFAHQRLSETNLTVQELLTLVEQIVTERLNADQPAQGRLSRTESAAWWRAMITDLIVPTPGTPSATDLLREERDQWYKQRA